MKNTFIILIISFCYSNFSYQSLLLPNSTDDLVSGYSQYTIMKQIIYNKKIENEVSASIITLPQDIQINSINYLSLPYNSINYFSINIIDYGQFTDSESNTHFSAKDIIAHNNFIKPFSSNLYGLIGMSYLNSQIENYSSSLLCMRFSFFFKYNQFLFQSSVNNYGFIINQYTNYNEVLPTYYSASILFLPKYLNSTVLLQHHSFKNYNVTNVFGELFIATDYSITVGYTSLAQKLHFEDFENNFFTGFSLGLNIKYESYKFNIGVKNLGSIGLTHSITLTKLFN